ncbi:MAG: hypothetical protein JXA30_12990 [Deltaproteobacteria bacterium]|nr:hypothetical protein [Deltaproteobacteria bacterium]
MPFSSYRNYLAIALASFTVVFFEVLVTRILSVVLWYHWAFLSISLAMLGIGAPGVWFAVYRVRDELVPLSLYAAAVFLAFSIVVLVNFGASFGVYSALVCMLVIALPMLALGVAICILLIEAPGASIARMYGADLAGASLAALMIIPSLDAVATPLLGVVAGAVPLLAGWLLSFKHEKRHLSITAPLTIGAAICLVAIAGPLKLNRTKSYDEREMKPLLEKWTHTARLVFFDGLTFGDRNAVFGWGLGSRAPRVKIEQIWLEQDGSAGTPITRFDDDLNSVSFLNFDVTTLPFQFASPRSVAIIGAGGGRDILSARLNGATQIDAVEMNRSIVKIVSGRFREFSGDVYRQRGVRPIISEGRSFLSGSRRRYDVIQISLIDSWAATAAGAFSLTENNLYTIEAYQLYWKRLSAGGIISTSRWMKGWLGMELVRLIRLCFDALDRIGVAHPDDHLAIVGGGSVGTVLMSKIPFRSKQVARLSEICRTRGFTLYYPAAKQRSDGSPTGVSEIVREQLASRDRSGLDLSSPSDDRPFFFQMLKVFSPRSRRTALALGFNGEATFALQLLMVTLIALTVMMFFLPFALSRGIKRTTGFWRGTFFFAAIGSAFMLVEVASLQRFILLLGHPSVATTVVLGSMLLGAGIGSALSTRFGVSAMQRWGWLVSLVLAAANLALPTLFGLGLGLGLAYRIVVAIGFVMPFGLLMGVFLPLGMMRFGDRSRAWFWAINGACSVAASVVSLALAMTFGFSTVAWIGAGLYLIAWVFIRESSATKVAKKADATAD